MNNKFRFVPRIGGFYYTFSDKPFLVVSQVWLGTAEDYFALKSGAVFRTRQAANDARCRIYKELTGEEL